MTRHYKLTALLLLGGIMVVAFVPFKKMIRPAANKGFAVVELFTSEGCSSCPAADAAVERLLAKKMDNVFVLAFHVDYWDRGGWKDPFSNADYSKRQNGYASKFKLGSVYTPQVIVNGESEFVGSDETRLLKTVSTSLNAPAAETLIVKAKKVNNTVMIDYDLGIAAPALLNIALIEPSATSIVKHGENGGRTLHHVNIVRAFKSMEAKGRGSISLNVAQDIAGTPLQIIAYVQSSDTYHLSAAVQKPVE